MIELFLCKINACKGERERRNKLSSSTFEPTDGVDSLDEAPEHCFLLQELQRDGWELGLGPLEGARRPPHLPDDGRGAGEAVDHGEARQTYQGAAQLARQELRRLGEKTSIAFGCGVFIQEFNHIRDMVASLEAVVEC